MKATYLDDKLRIIIRGDPSEIRDCAKLILEVTNGDKNSHRNSSVLKRLLNGEASYLVGNYKKEEVKVSDGRLIYGFMHTRRDASVDAMNAARNHYIVIKENIQHMNIGYDLERG